MKLVVITSLLALMLSGCVGPDAYRPRQMLSVRVNGEQSHNYTLFLADLDKRIQFQQSNGVHTVELPGITYSSRYVFSVPVSSGPEKQELVVFSRNESDIDGMSVQNMRNTVRTKDGVYQIKLR